ncbi:LysM peptidoglycan-binding domain-containing protein [Zooshikella marina]|uniref:CIS tube protein n=1 Tax=Zooshikella ganghwensis TaxID=202772 RepID=UPI001BAF7E4A|nr:LysM peptidoglycan-binding domain-containing protein [Zooshikella ganghwensis]MBU2705434.1 LysM peptidoglycan-binding domain-containing protein [Zooshikella ganghwensis]
MSENRTEKLTIEAFEDIDRKKVLRSFELKINPLKFIFSIKNNYTVDNAIGSSGSQMRFLHGRNRQLSLQLRLDGTGTKEDEPIAKQVDSFINITQSMVGKIHQPPFLNISWGDIKEFFCRLDNASIDYTAFDTKGVPIAATIDCSFTEDLSEAKRSAQDKKSSPDLTHLHVVASKENLPMIAKKYYGSTRFYMQLAKVNKLNNVTNLVTGSRIIIPPLSVVG